MNVREMTEKIERDTLSQYAVLSENSKGREKPCEEDDLRTCFQRDRDRIIHSKAFRRLMHKTQVFISPEGDHYITRLTHTLEVAQIARTMAVALRLNESLTEAIAMGHDIGHTPFGHCGERALNDLAPGGFKHYEQSLRTVDVLERNGEGLNLTWEVRNGILRHTCGEMPSTLEGQLVRYADYFAFTFHDMKDAIRAGIISEDSVPREIKNILGDTASERLSRLVTSLVSSSKDKITMDSDCEYGFSLLTDFMFKTVYTDSIAKSQEKKAGEMIKSLYGFFMENPSAMPSEYQAIALRDGLDRAICDYISGMSDRYAVKIYKDYFIPKGWAIE